MNKPKRIDPISVELFMEMREEYQGMCIVCGEVRDQCEPDARRYSCINDECGLNRVYGAEELVLMGLVEGEGP